MPFSTKSGQVSAGLVLGVPDALVEAVADRVASLLVERLPQQPEPYLTVEAAATYLGRPKSRVYELVAAKKVAHYRDGRALLFRRGDLDACLRPVAKDAAR